MMIYVELGLFKPATLLLIILNSVSQTKALDQGNLQSY